MQKQVGKSYIIFSKAKCKRMGCSPWSLSLAVSRGKNTVIAVTLP